MKISKFIIALCFIICASCNRTGDEDNIRLITVDVHTQAAIEDIVKSLDGYIFLETNDSSILQGIDKLKIEHDTIYIADGDVLHLFGRKDGKWLGKIDRQGRGPGEYADMTDFDIYDSKIYVLSRPDRKIITYDMSGKMLHELQTEDWFEKMKVLDNNRVWLYSSRSNETHYDYVLVNLTTGKSIGRHARFAKNGSYIFSDDFPFCGQQSDSIFVAKYFDNIVYVLRPESYDPAYMIDINLKNAISQKELEETGYKELSEEYGWKECLHHINHIAQNGDTLFADVTCFLTGRALRTCFVKTTLKDSKSSLFYLLNEEKNAKFPLFNVGRVEGYAGKTAISSIYAGLAKTTGEEYGFEDLAAMSEYDNPVLVFHTLNY